jgi:hypothetical protein
MTLTDGAALAIVVSNAANSTTTGWPVDFWWTELACPFHAFEEREYEIDGNSITGQQ